LVAPLNAAVADSDGPCRSVGVGNNLDFDMPRGGNQLLEEHRWIAEGKLCLAARGCQCGGQLARLADHPNSTPTTTGRSFEHDRVTEQCGAGSCIVRVDDWSATPWDDRDVDLLGEPFGQHLVAEHAHAGAVGTDEDDACFLASLRERGGLGEETPPDPGHVGLDGTQCRDDTLLVEVDRLPRAVGRVDESGGAERDGLVSHLDIPRVGIRRWV
jgi:hypothetical protein